MVQRRSRVSSSSTNPFDSDEESPSKYSSKTAPKAGASYANPFDDEQPKFSAKNPFDDEQPKFSAKNPFDDDEPRIEPKLSAKNPFDDDQGEAVVQKKQVGKIKPGLVSEPGKIHGNESVDGPPVKARPRRREAMREKISTVSGDVASKASRMKQESMEYITRPRSKNVMNGGNQNRKLLLDNEDDVGASNVERRAAHDRIERAVKDKTSLDGESVQELESYGIHKAEETTKTVYNALKVAEEIKEGANNTAIKIQEQGEQIRRTHYIAVDIDHDLSRGEKLLGSLGGLFSRTWKPKKMRDITGPVITRGDSFKRKAYALEQRAALGLGKDRTSGNRTSSTSTSTDSSQFQTRVQSEFSKQDDALSDLSNVLGELKAMSIDMGDEIQRQTHDLAPLEDDIVELGNRVKNANERTRRLLGR